MQYRNITTDTDSNDWILLKANNKQKTQRLVLNLDILYVEYSNYDCHVFLSDNTEIVCPQPLRYFLQKLNSEWFFQANNTFIVNKLHIVQVVKIARRSYNIKMKNGVDILISTRRWKAFKEWYSQKSTLRG